MKRSTHWMMFVLAIGTLLVPREAAAQSDRAAADKTLSPYFFVEGGDPAVDRLPLKETHVDVAITGVIADVTVRQVYENRGTRPLHARYVFPASTRAAVYGMTMTVGNVRIVARIKERAAGRARVRGRASATGKSASLLEQSRPNVFSMKVANVLPGDTIAVELKYTELLVPTDGVYEFVYPTVVGPRYSSKRESEASPGDEFVKTPYTHQGEAPRSEFHLSGVVSTGVPLQELASPSHQLDDPLDRTGPRGDDAAPTPTCGRAIATSSFATGWPAAEIGSGLLLYQGRDENFFLLMAEPPQAVAGRRDAAARVRLRARRVGIDVRLSAGHGEDADGRPRRTSFDRPTRSTSWSLPTAPRRSRRVSVPATRANLARALQFIGRKNGGGGTELLGALERAVSLPRHGGHVAQHRPGDRRLHRRRSRRVRLRPRATGRHERLRVRHRQQREPAPDRRRRAGGARRAVHRHRTRRGDGGGRRGSGATSTRPCSPAST